MKNKSYFILSFMLISSICLKAVDEIKFNPKNWSVGQTVKFAGKKGLEIRDIKECAGKTKFNTAQYKAVYYVYIPSENKTATITVTEEYNLDKKGNVSEFSESSEKFAYDEDTLLKRAVGYFNYWTQKILGSSASSTSDQ
ncbi:MAG: hypothetical protein BWY54_00419 [Candidatus Dependentiae bacterium ADurb.Bin331]|nr:MAG: hypothetical protein BWY54_00419 [Candidatus Dependentiae bacterium ADurb.Bin331]